MKNLNLNLLVKINPVVVIDCPDHAITAIYVGKKLIGYTATNIKSGKKTSTPFTAFGELPEEHCDICATSALFAQYCDISHDDVDVVEKELRSVDIKSSDPALALLAAIIAARLNRR
ncbi:hypothetical protein [Pantoea agglomerans]|uniref:hypothetical protein n=1 Tax=Enterobacter agglomerans TaxID=549 RepID=UPI003FD3DDCE